ncbi:MAG TPA: PqqD family protein [Bacteroidetes bacterium]|nr:PqqD family protein [Bacteroidota bacterium]
MEDEATLEGRYRPSEDVVARVIEGELVIIPLKAGVGDMEDELFSLNPTGREVWNRFNGERTLGEIVREIAEEYEGESAEIERDIIGLACVLLQRKLISAVS